MDARTPQAQTRTVSDVYAAYGVSEGLAQHMLRAAAIAEVMGAEPSLVRCLLIHDIGDVLTADTAKNARVADLSRRAGGDRRAARKVVASDLGFGDEETGVFDYLGVARVPDNLAHRRYDALIATYAEFRQGPDGVLPLAESLVSTVARQPEFWAHPDRQAGLAAMSQVESELQQHCRTPLETISDATIDPVVERLRGTTI